MIEEMTEKGVDKTTGSRTDRAQGGRMKLLAGILVVVMVVAGAGALLWYKTERYSSYPHQIDVYLDTVYTESAWLIKVVSIKKHPESQPDIDERSIEYRLLDKPGSDIERQKFSEIKHAPSAYGILWEDADNNGLVDVGDYLQISKEGGSLGRVNEVDNTIYFYDVIIVFYPREIYLPPADFLDMDVQKTPTGWNMTVTWVNEAVPEWVFRTTSFRLENASGEFFTTYKDTNIVGEWYTVMGLGGIYYKYEYKERYDGNSLYVTELGTHRDMGYYNMTWYDYDNDYMLSVNDSIIIDNDRHLVKPGFSFKLIHQHHYGAVHVMEEIILS
ncbi:MAG: hypothetical protein AB1665_06270 [Candidatus Thermoplasmatota archaeon]